MKRHFMVLLAACVGGLVALSGCGSGPSAGGTCLPVKGKVTLGGKLLVGGDITFVPLDGAPGRARPEGTVDKSGNYSVKTAGTEGAPAGKYRAVLTVSGEDREQLGQFDPLYSHWEKSPLVVEVKENVPAGAYDLKMTPLKGR
jgi:hypothetical protein